eukprot:GHVP01018903.1.p2 GENE.GHVP01018903.1~~GHVP01018903.1.p2  ORF type:complete len:809 (-),score=167.13 GHVP01018903.1:2677-5037(-)
MTRGKGKRPGATATALSSKFTIKEEKETKEPKESTAAGSPPPEVNRNTKTQEKNRRKKEKKRRENAEKSVIQTIQSGKEADPAVAAREETYEKLLEIFQSIPALNTLVEGELLEKKDAINANLDALDKQVHATVVQHIKETRKPDDKNLTTEELMELIVKSKNNPTSHTTAYYENQLRLALGWKNLREFQTNLNNLRKDIAAQKIKNEQVVKQTLEAQRKAKILQRIRELKLAKFPDNDLPPYPKETEISSVTVDLTPEAMRVLSGPAQVSRKIERYYGVVIDKAFNNNRRGVVVSGFPEDVQEAQQFLTRAEFSRKFTVSLAGQKSMAQLIGTRGAGIRKIESENNCFIHADGSTLHIIGSMEDAAAVQQQILSSSMTTKSSDASADFEIPGYLSKALYDLASSEQREIETNCNVVVKFNTFRNGTKGNIFIKGKPEGVEAAKKQVNALIEKYTSVKFRLTPVAITKLLSTARQSGIQDSDYKSATRQVIDEFQTIKNNSRCSFSRDPDDDATLVMVGTPEDVQRTRSKVESVVLYATMEPSELVIQQPQLRYFEQDSRALVVMESGAKLVVGRPNSAGEVTIELLGTEDQINTASQMIREIMDRDAFIAEYEFTHPETIQNLKRNKGQKLLEMQSSFGVAINIQPSNIASIVGSRVGVEDAILAFQKADEETKNRISKTIPIEPHMIRVIVGKGGSTIQNIRGTSGIDVLNVQDEGLIVMKGSLEAITIAESLIRQVCKEADDRAQSAENRQPATPKASAPATPPKVLPNVFADDPSSFPPLHR